MATEVTYPANTIDEIRTTPVEEITRGQVQRWYDEFHARSANVKTDDEWDECVKLSDALGSKLRESIESAPQDERDELLSIVPTVEEWAAGIADTIEKAREAGQWRAAQLGERTLQEAFDQKVITKN